MMNTSLSATKPTRAAYGSVVPSPSWPEKNVRFSSSAETTLSSYKRSNCRGWANPEAISPFTTAVIRSTNTVRLSVTSITKRCSRRITSGPVPRHVIPPSGVATNLEYHMSGPLTTLGTGSEAPSLPLATGGSLPRNYGGSASALRVSGPARRSLQLRPRIVAEPPLADRCIGVLQTMSLPPSSAPAATGWSDSCRAGFAPAEEWHLFAAHVTFHIGSRRLQPAADVTHGC